jgi:hypothetical protein
VGDQTFGCFESYGSDGLQEIDELECVGSVIEEKVETIWCFFDVGGVGVHVVFQDELFQKEECTFVVDLLTDLSDSVPCVLSSNTSAFVALLPQDDKLDDKDLLQDGSSENLFLDGQFHFETLAVWLSVNKAGVHQFHFVQSSNSLHAQREKFPGF